MSASGPHRKRILIVDDEDEIRGLLTQLLSERGFETEQASSGEDALQILGKHHFDLVLSDVRMPGMGGFGLLSEIAQRHRDVAVLMLTGCEDVSMAVDAMKTGALDYVLKPFQLENVVASIRRGLEKHEQTLESMRRSEQLERVVRDQSAELRRMLSHLEEASEGTLEALVAALDAREHETKAHSRRVSEYAVHLAGQMDLDADAREVIRRGAMLHDIGKIGISDRILLKPARLTEGEWEEMRKHPLIGYWILRGVEALKKAAEIVLAHHERFDGLGYPRRLAGEAIPLGARIFSVVDSLDAMTSDRPYHKGKTCEEARQEITRNSGTQFDPVVVDYFLREPPQVWDDIRRRTLETRPGAFPEIAPLVLT